MMNFKSGEYFELLNSSGIVEGIGWTLVHSLWQFTCLAVVALFLGRAMHRQASSLRYVVNAVFMLLMLVAPIVTWFSLPQTMRENSERASVPESALVSVAPGGSFALPRTTGASDAQPTSPPSELLELTSLPMEVVAAEPLLTSFLWTHVTESIEPWLAGLVVSWICGVVAFAFRPALSWYTVRRLRTVGVVKVDESIQRMVDKLKRTFAVRQSVEVLQSSLVQTPVVVGCFRSVILLPLGLISNFPLAQLEAILAHELVHVRRYDYLVNLVQTMMETIFFYHPAIWWLSRRVRIERENCCDDLVVTALGDRVQYGRALLAVEELKEARSILALGAVDGSLLSRVERILGVRKNGAAPLSLGLSSAALLVLVVIGITWSITTVSAKTDSISAPDFGVESHGLRCRVVGLKSTALNDSPDLAESIDQFANSKEMTFAVELKNFSDRSITLGGVSRGGAKSNGVPGKPDFNLFAPLWFEFEFMDKGGKPISRTRRDFFNAAVIAYSASIHELAPGASLVVVCRPGQFISPMNFELAGGEYQVKVRYRGLENDWREDIRRTSPDNPILGTWSHAVDSPPIAFSLKEDVTQPADKNLVWGEPKNGLQAAIEFRVPDDVQGDPKLAPGIPVGTSIGIVFHVKNISNELVTFVSETGRQGDEAHVVNELGENIKIDNVFFTGWPIDVAWTLKPGEIAELSLLTPSLQSLQQPGKYKVHYTIRFNSRQMNDDLGNPIFPRPGDYDKELDTGESTLILFDATNKESLIETKSQVPFRLPDHWIVEDARFVNQDRELRTVSIQGGVNVRRWDMVSRGLISEIKLAADVHGHSFRQETLQLSADGSRVLAATDDYVGVWDSLTGELLKRLPIPKQQWSYDCVRCLDCSADGSLVVAGLGTSFSRTTLRYDGYGIVWNVATEAVISRSTFKNGFYYGDVALSGDGSRYASCSELGGGVCIWETASGKLLHDLTAEIGKWQSPDADFIKNNLVNTIAFTPDDQVLAVSGTYGLMLFDVASGRQLKTIDVPYRYSSFQTEICFSADGSQIARIGASSSEDGYSVLISSQDTGETLFELASSASAGTFSNDGKLFAAAESDFYEAISVWPLEGEKMKSLAEPVAYSRINRVEENTHVRGDTAEEFVDQWRPTWGQAQQGIEYGIALTTNSHSFHTGERVLMAAFVRNVSNEPKHIALTPDMFGNLPLLTNSAGETVHLESRPLLGTPSHYRDTLQPGECFGPLYLNLGVGANPRPGAQVWEPFWRSPSLGSFKLVHKTDIHIAEQTVDTNSSLDGPGWVTGKLTSNAVEFEVSEREKF